MATAPAIPILAWLLLSSAAGGLGGCEGGTSSETVGLTGRVEAVPGLSGIAGRADPGTSLGLYSEDYQPQSDSGFARTATADSAGGFAFDGLAPGRYQLLARRAADGNAALLTGLEIPSSAGAAMRSPLEPTGTLSGTIADSLPAYAGIVFAPGTPFFAIGDSLMHYSLAGMPAGSYRLLKTWKRPLPCRPEAACGGLENRRDSAQVRIRPGEGAVW